MTNPETVVRPEVDDPRVLALAQARQQLAYENPFNAVCPPWGGLTEQEQHLSLLDARSYLHAVLRAGLAPAAVPVPPPATRADDRDALQRPASCGQRRTTPDARDTAGHPTGRAVPARLYRLRRRRIPRPDTHARGAAGRGAPVITFLAHVALVGRHRRTAVVGGYHWRYCGHRSHRRGLWCWRWPQWDGFCARHNRSCWTYCHKEQP